jgi:hypothetical protein
MRTLLFVFLSVFVFVGFTTLTQATYITYMNPVQLQLVDYNGDGQITLVQRVVVPLTEVVYWSNDEGSTWNPFPSPVFGAVSFSVPEGGSEELWLSLDAGDDIDGPAFFGGEDSEDPDLFRALGIMWGYPAEYGWPVSIYFTIGDRIAIPITSSAILLGSGVFGLIAFVSRRRRAMKF